MTLHVKTLSNEHNLAPAFEHFNSRTVEMYWGVSLVKDTVSKCVDVFKSYVPKLLTLEISCYRVGRFDKCRLVSDKVFSVSDSHRNFEKKK